jgi:hypothetical protein
MLWVFIFSYLYKNERKESSTPQTSFLMLEANKDYSRVIVESSSVIGLSSIQFQHFSLTWNSL